MRKNLERVMALAIFLALAAMPSAWAADIGEPAPPLVVKQFDGQTFDLSAMKGKVVLLHFWATWCPACRDEMDLLSRYYKKRRADGVEIIALSVEKPEDRIRKGAAAMMTFVEYPGALLADADVVNYPTPHTLPASYLIDANGIIRSIKIPDDLPMSEESLDALILPWIKAKPATIK